MQSTGMGNLHCTKVPDEAKEAHILPGIHTSLLSAGKLCDAGCVAIFAKEDVKVIKVNDQTKRQLKEIEDSSKVAMEGWRDTTNRLWRTMLEQNHQANTVKN